MTRAQREFFKKSIRSEVGKLQRSRQSWPQECLPPASPGKDGFKCRVCHDEVGSLASRLEENGKTQNAIVEDSDDKALRQVYMKHGAQNKT
jgi:hypothetical protein